ncbi:MlaD family protein [Nocardia huaxiensis]|uniref:MCE family protein n=1 Tax=Nocardia huaxiensis TaxID=2755382 RepID=A0A7D6ZCU0_9NOCA|nr:MlaD family protein [Nocardia huaxiensis]QLY30618.1 MCE family protein [Nocardia huaxiensis]UFS95776.1 MlaD family protein [Nocardia huaxiensis]
MRWGSVASLGAIAAVTVVGASYLTFGVVRADPFAEYTNASMVLKNSGGLSVGSPILLTGMRVGKVTSIEGTAQGIEVGFRVDADRKLPTDSVITIEQLSALGEPYVEFRPRTGSGPYLTDGQRLDTSAVKSPLSIPEVSRLVNKVMNQLDPKVAASLAATLGAAFDDTESSMPQLTRAGDLLAAAIMSREPKIAQLLNSFQATASDMAGIPEATAAAAPAFLRFEQSLEELIDAVGRLVDRAPGPQVYVDGDGLAPFLAKLTEWLQQAGPELQTLAPQLQPLVDAARTAGPQINISSLVSQALASTSDGAVRVQVNVK